MAVQLVLSDAVTRPQALTKAGEDTVGGGERGGVSWHEAAHLGKDDANARRAQQRAFPAHIGSRQQQTARLASPAHER